MAKDPVCGMDAEGSKICSTYDGQKYCFCSKMCKETFDKDPSKYIKAGEKKKSSCC